MIIFEDFSEEVVKSLIVTEIANKNGIIDENILLKAKESMLNDTYLGEELSENLLKLRGEEEDLRIQKAIREIELAVEKGLISEDVLIKSRVGKYADNPINRKLNRVGVIYGHKKEEYESNKKNSKKEDVQNGDKIPLEEQAKSASESSLETASKEAKDPEVRTTAYKELDRRQKEEKTQREESKEENSDDWIKEFSSKYKLNRLPIGISKEKVKMNFEGDINSHWVMKWVDSKTGKEQMSYTKEFLQKNAEYKWDRIKNIKQDDIDKMSIVLKNALKSKDLKEKQVGAVLNIILNTGLRIGSKEGFKETQNRGVSTLNSENIKVNGDKISLEFIGKSYKNNTAEFVDKDLAEFLSELKEKNKEKEFIFDGINDDYIRDYFHDNVNKDLKIKDIRTYIATNMARLILFDDKSSPPPLPKTGIKKAIQSKLTNLYKTVSEQLNNTPSMAKNSYIHPKVVEDWLKMLNITLG